MTIPVFGAVVDNGAPGIRNAPAGTMLIPPTSWRYRCWWGDRPGPWALAPLDLLCQELPQWTAMPLTAPWLAWPRDDDDPDGPTPPARVPIPVIHRSDGFFDLTALGPPLANRSRVLLTTDLTVNEATSLTILAAADWWMTWWCDAQRCFVRPEGNRYPPSGPAHRFDVTLTPGQHRLSVLLRAGSRGWALGCEAWTKASTPPAGLDTIPDTMEAQASFTVLDTARWPSVSCDHGEEVALLNGHPLPVSTDNMRRQWQHGLDPALVLPGTNLLSRRHPLVADLGLALATRAFTGVVGLPLPGPPLQLVGVATRDIAIRSGPLLHYASATSITVSCRTTGRCGVALTLADRRLYSSPGLVHHFIVDGLTAGQRWPGHLHVVDGTASAPFTACTLDPQRFSLLLYGDPSPNPEILAQVAARMRLETANGAIFLGDAINAGCNDAHWDDAYFAPAADFLAETPHWWVPGNHDQDADLWRDLLRHPGDAACWAQHLGPLLLVGIDGARDWSDPELQARLRDQLTSAARFRILCTHYPAWTSTPHGRLGSDGQPVEITVRRAREHLLPLCRAAGVDAIVNGHAHCYERCHPDGGPVVITSGGAGGFPYRASPRLEMSRVFHPVHHYCRLDVTPERLVLTAVALDGTLLDRWEPDDRARAVPGDRPSHR